MALKDKRSIALEELYDRLNKREYVHPDPLEFLYNYTNPRDIEIVGLVASSLAYGKVEQILKSVSSILSRMPEPSEFLKDSSYQSLKKAFKGFKHRFTTGDEVAAMLNGAARAIERWGSIESMLRSVMKKNDGSIVSSLTDFVGILKTGAGSPCDTLLPDPDRGSACKRLNLFLRWMVRRDEVDPGIWYNLQPSGLVVPLDVHMHRIGLHLGLTMRKQADMRTAVEITDSFREFNEDDPVRYDFALTRLGIRSDIDSCVFFEQCGLKPYKELKKA